MDTSLFAMSLLTFAVLYLGLNIFLFWTLVITFLVIMFFLSVRWRHLGENYPYGAGETLTLVILVTVTWVLFVFLGPKNPIPWLGPGLTYSTPNWTSIIDIALVLMFAVMILFAILIPFFQGKMSQGGGDGGEGGGKPKMGVGAG